MSLIIDYPWYFVIFCLLLGTAYAFLLYWLKMRKKEVFSRRVKIWLSLLRGLAVSAIAFLLLSPLVRRDTNRKEKPIIVIAEDNSKSLDYCKDSAYYHGDFIRKMDDLAKELSRDFDVQRYRYGSNVEPASETEAATLMQAGSLRSSFADAATDMSQLMSEIGERYWHRNVGAVVVTGDGIYNRGENPLGKATDLAVPVFTVAMGDTTVRRDAAVTSVRFNRIAYLGNMFPLEITVNATRLNGEKATLSVTCEGKKLFSKQLVLGNGDDNKDGKYTTVETVTLEADRAGLHNYVVELSPLHDEVTLRNNRRVVTVEVIDGHQKVALIAAVPHPDIAALRRSIENNQNYEVECFLAKDFKGNPKDYNLMVFHQLPSKAAETGLDMDALLKSGVPALFVLGSQTDLARFNALHAGMEIFSRIERQNEASALQNRDFTYFTFSDDAASRIEQFPPLVSPFGEYKLSGNAQTLFVSKVGSVNSGLPLVAVTQQGESRYAFIAGEGLWRWSLADWQNNQSHTSFDEFVSKLVTFTALRANNEKFRVETKSVFSENEHITLEAQLYNDNYETVNTPDVKLVVTSRTDGQKRTYSFNRTSTGYAINLGRMETGEYSYTASTSFNGRNHTSSGSFMVEDLQLEALNLVADHSLLATLSATTGGEMVDARDVDRLVQLLKERDDMKTVIYSETRYSDMLNMPLIFILIILLLGTEWVTRKMVG